MPEPMPVYSTLCRHHMDMAVEFYPTLLRNCRDAIRLTVLDDGTLDDAAVARLAEHAPQAVVVRRKEYEERTFPLLSRHPNCLAYCHKHAFGTKLIVTGLLAAGGRFGTCDTDIAFFRPFTGLDRGSETAMVCMKDEDTAYSVGYFQRHVGRTRIRLPEYVNSGLMFCPPGTWDLDFVEWFLGQAAYVKVRWVIEQTAFAALVARSPGGGRYFSTEQVTFPRGRVTPERCAPSNPDRPVAIHFTTPNRPKIPAFRPMLTASAAIEQPAVHVATEPAAYQGVVAGVASRLVKRVAKRGGRA